MSPRKVTGLVFQRPLFTSKGEYSSHDVAALLLSTDTKSSLLAMHTGWPLAEPAGQPGRGLLPASRSEAAKRLLLCATCRLQQSSVIHVYLKKKSHPCPMCMHLLAFTVPCRVPVTGSLARSNSHVEIAVLGVGGSHRVNSHAQGDTINKFTYD